MSDTSIVRQMRLKAYGHGLDLRQQQGRWFIVDPYENKACAGLEGARASLSIEDAERWLEAQFPSPAKAKTKG